jgi:hypothetical protein
MKKLILGAVLYALVGAHAAQADSWRILFYMDSIEDLNDMAIKAVTEMMCARPSDSIEFYIQLHAYGKAGLRYKLDNQKLAVDSEVVLTGDAKQDLLDAARWGFAGHTADHTMILFSNHGWGILDPIYNPATEKWEGEYDQVGEMCVIKKGFGSETHTQELHAQLMREAHKRHRGFMFNKVAQTYLTNQDLVASLQLIQQDILQGKALDILAFDTCMGAMIEVAYQVAPHARYLVGSQSCSLKDGFDYKGVISVLNQEQNSPEMVATGMVRAFDAYYNAHDASGIYTHAALDLSHVESVIQALNSLMVLVLALPDRASLLQGARDHAPRFCMWPMYTDLVSFCNLIEKNLRACDSADISRILYSAIYQAIANIRSAVNKMAVARCAGAVARADAHGCAIYCPPASIDSSYTKTEFAQSCKWYQALQVMCGQPVPLADSGCVHAISF